MSLELDLDTLLAPLGDDQPCGPNLEYDADFLQMEEAARGQAGQEFASDSGSKVSIDGQEADWPAVRRLAEGLLERTRDVRVAVYYTRALLRTEGYPGIHAGLRLIVGLLEQHWAGVHPELDADDNDDPTMRVNALAPLVANDAVIGDLRASTLLRSRQSGVLTVRNIEVTQGKLSARDGEQVLAESQVAGMLAEAVAADPTLADAITDSVALARQLSGFLQDQVGAGASIDFKPLQNVLYAVQQALGGVALPAADGPGEAAAGEEGAPAGVPAAGTPAAPGEIRSRADVVATIDRLVTYLERSEPTNPAQWLLRRAQRVMNMNFLEAIVELAPDGLEQAERMVGGQLNPEQDD
ncbi:type VI secretion system protein TssA [Azoarcus olearius]|uniref:Cytoplasmic protein n=1 Tax=Azoarcus sp. (strain BH72) TaxID=418699 RepID=A1KCF4_AZOSB|nr:type VI secretion system protein TssA [Azoarcus olearius]CAL96510.1 putative cytoplasmic protein [Azoarcus olearius]